MHLQAAANQVIFLSVLHPGIRVLFGPVAGVGNPVLGQRVSGKVFRQAISLQAVLSHHDFEHLGHTSRVHAGTGQDVHANPVGFLFVGAAVGQHVLHSHGLGAGDGGNANV